MRELTEIQSAITVRKSQMNKFGGFKYRNAEDILESAKDAMKANNCNIILNDEIVNYDGRFFILSTATITNSNGESVCTHAYAELDEHKGMSKEQCCGSASSYARKYALCGLLAIDDSEHDPDALESQPAKNEKKPQPAKKKLTKEQMEVLWDKFAQCKAKSEIDALFFKYASAYDGMDTEANRQRLNTIKEKANG